MKKLGFAVLINAPYYYKETLLMIKVLSNCLATSLCYNESIALNFDLYIQSIYHLVDGTI